jgi:hypothetical protein
MAKPSASVVVDFTVDLDRLVRQLEHLRVLCSQIGFALDTAILALHETRDAPDRSGADA